MKKLICILIFSLLFISSAGSADKPEQVSAVKLESLSVDNSQGFNHLRFLIKGRKPGNFEPILDVKKAAQKSLEYFFIGLIMHDEAFWVNLNPDEPERIIEPALGNTDLGRIMLNADFRLKEDVSNLINPQTSQTGKEFWRRLYQKAQELTATDRIPVVTRLWIIPGETMVLEKDREFSIVKSTLRVRLEPAYLSQRLSAKDKRQQELEDFAAELMEELVLPQLNKRVNEAYAYTDLREVYNALLLAQWYKQRFNPFTDSLLKVTDYRILNDVELNYSYQPEQIYQDYLKSLKEGQYSFTETDTTAGGFYTVITTRHYFSGGVDFTNIRLSRTNNNHQDEDKGVLLACDLFIPQGIDRPLQYAKNQLEVTSGNVITEKNATLALARNLPAITPIRFAEQNMQSLNAIDKTERILLSKL